MKRGTKICIAVSAALLVIGAALDYFRVESWTLAWHVRHGFHAELGDLRLRVPFLYEADDPNGLPWIDITHYPGRVSKGFSLITVDFHPPRSAEDWRSGRWETVMQKMGLKRVRERSIAFAGRPGECFEYIQDQSGTQEAARRLIQGTGQIFCSFGNVDVDFMGTTSLEDEFYGFIQAAESVHRKN